MPFTFLETDSHIDELNDRMNSCGFQSVGIVRNTNPYSPTVMKFTCPWLPGSEVNLTISTRWWDDGETPEDSKIELARGECTKLTLDIERLLGEKLEVPLREFLMNEISKFACSISGKRFLQPR